ncbi:MAG: hypothetical protein OEU26_17540 [Candidatus Tectomicrobia bacterium]|nr:hypothetical protein [Candidatus Tectomicrobia bacterium]
MSKALIFCLAALFIAGCATTDDPRQGGLFSYNRDAYEARLQSRRDTLSELERNKQQLGTQSGELTHKKSTKLETRDQQSARVRALDKDLAKLRRHIDQLQKDVTKYQATTAAKQREKQRVVKDIQRVQTQMAKLEDSELPPQSSYSEEYAKLQREVDTLLEIAAQLQASH